MKQSDCQTSPSGVLLVDKEESMTSHDVVAIARRSLGIKKIGHCGTLDPMATGLIMLVIGRATKMQEALMSDEKEYEGTLTLGVSTFSQDRTGEVTAKSEVPSNAKEQLQEVFESFLGPFYQVPPMVSAIKQKGKRLYKLAREGKVVEREPRAVEVKAYQIHRVELPEVEFSVSCSKGFYVRTYAHDIGEKLGCGGHLSALRRVRSGSFTLDGAVSIEQLKQAPRDELLQSMITLEELADIKKA